jgi:hypothetical protein
MGSAADRDFLPVALDYFVVHAYFLDEFPAGFSGMKMGYSDC